MPSESVYFPDNSSVLFQPKRNQRNIEETLAKEMAGILMKNEYRQQIIEVVETCRDEYRPFGSGSMVGNFNPKTYYRTRGPEVESLLGRLKKLNSDQIPFQLGDFFQKGAWNISGAVSGASLNVLLVSRLTQLTLRIFREKVTLEQLRYHDLVELSFAINRGEWSAEESSERVSGIFHKIVLKEETATTPSGSAAASSLE